MSRYRAVLFDMDGTLLDTLQDMRASMNRVLLANHYPPRSLAELRLYVGNGARNLTRRALPPDTPEDEVERVFALYRQEYRTHFCVDTVLAVEVKLSSSISDKQLKGLRALREEGIFRHYVVVCQEEHPRAVDGMEILPWKYFFERLWAGDYLS